MTSIHLITADDVERLFVAALTHAAGDLSQTDMILFDATDIEGVEDPERRDDQDDEGIALVREIAASIFPNDDEARAALLSVAHDYSDIYHETLSWIGVADIYGPSGSNTNTTNHMRNLRGELSIKAAVRAAETDAARRSQLTDPV